MPRSPDQPEPRRLYLDNAATSFPKPPAVIEAMVRYATDLGASAGRGAYREAMETGRLITECRRRLQRLFHGEAPENFIFTLNCTDALNLAIKGLIDPSKKGHAICTHIDHNSILRPLNALADAGLIEQTRVAVDGQTGLVDPKRNRQGDSARHAADRHHPRQQCHRNRAADPGNRRDRSRAKDSAFIVDAAQSAGHLPIDVQADCIDLLAAPGHKGLLGPLGTGFLYIRPGLEKTLRPIREGGTGS